MKNKYLLVAAWMARKWRDVLNQRGSDVTVIHWRRTEAKG